MPGTRLGEPGLAVSLFFELPLFFDVCFQHFRRKRKRKCDNQASNQPCTTKPTTDHGPRQPTTNHRAFVTWANFDSISFRPALKVKHKMSLLRPHFVGQERGRGEGCHLGQILSGQFFQHGSGEAVGRERGVTAILGRGGGKRGRGILWPIPTLASSTLSSSTLASSALGRCTLANCSWARFFLSVFAPDPPPDPPPPLDHTFRGPKDAKKKIGQK